MSGILSGVYIVVWMCLLPSACLSPLPTSPSPAPCIVRVDITPPDERFRCKSRSSRRAPAEPILWFKGGEVTSASEEATIDRDLVTFSGPGNISSEGSWTCSYGNGPQSAAMVYYGKCK